MSTSKMQRKVSQELLRRFKGYTIFENSRPEWLDRLELDFWIIELDIAIEVQGAQHYYFTPHFHQNYDDFKAQQERDQIKRRRCEAYGITLLEVDDDLSFSEAIQVIRKLVKADKLQGNKFKTARRHNRIIRALSDQFEYLSSKTMDEIEYAHAIGHLRYQLSIYIERNGAKALNAVKPEIAQKLLKAVKSATKEVQKNLAKRHTQRTKEAGFAAPMPGDKLKWHFRPTKRNGEIFIIDVEVIDVTPSQIRVCGIFEGSKIVSTVNRRNVGKVLKASSPTTT